MDDDVMDNDHELAEEARFDSLDKAREVKMALGGSEEDVVLLEGCLAKHETEKAYLVLYEGEELWLPKSQIVEESSEEIQIGETGTIAIKEWLAKEKNLV